jgi:hypothetical protein
MRKNKLENINQHILRTDDHKNSVMMEGLNLAKKKTNEKSLISKN